MIKQKKCIICRKLFEINITDSKNFHNPNRRLRGSVACHKCSKTYARVYNYIKSSERSKLEIIKNKLNKKLKNTKDILELWG